MGLLYVEEQPLRDYFDRIRVNRINTPSDVLVIPDQFFGVEIEIENIPGAFINAEINGWDSKDDGSLRGMGRREFVFDGPQAPGQAVESINAFYDVAKKFRANPAENASFRTSIHVHMDFSRTTPYANGLLPDTMHGAQVTSLLYYALEDQFFGIANQYSNGLDRKMSGYSFEIDAAPNDFYRWLAYGRNAVEVGRYYGLNVQSISTFGTLEFRHMPLIFERDILLNWLDTLARLKTFAYKNMRQDVEGGAAMDVLENPKAVQQALPYVFHHFPKIIASYDQAVVDRRMRDAKAFLRAHSHYNGGPRTPKKRLPMPAPNARTVRWNAPVMPAEVTEAMRAIREADAAILRRVDQEIQELRNATPQLDPNPPRPRLADRRPQPPRPQRFRDNPFFTDNDD